ncbi:hypothetical protein IW262DRAFT_1297384 [Armillaria fumosa]|nr:hypothetical protein IW262DRAFT_1297384 [Armillaria fumosa]
MANVARLGLTALEEEAMVMKEKLDKVLPNLIVETNLTPSSKNFSAIAPEITCPICYSTMRSVVQAMVTSPPRPDDRVQNIAKAFPDPEPQDDSCDAEIRYEGIESWKKMFSADITTAIDVSHLFDFSPTNFLLGPAYMDEDEDSDDTNRVAIFHSPLRSPQALPQTPTRSEKYSLRPRPRPSAHNTPSCVKSPLARHRERANKNNHGPDTEDNPGWKRAYEMLLKSYTRLQKDYDVLTKRVQMAKVEARREGTSRTSSCRTQSSISASGSASRTNLEPDSPEPHMSNVYSLLS